PHSDFKNALTVSTVGESAVKYFGFAAGKGSALVVCPRFCNCSGAAGFCGPAAGTGCCAAGGACGAVEVPVCAPATAVTLRTAVNPANTQSEIFKETILRRRFSRAALLLHLNLDRNGKSPTHSERLSRYLQHRSRLLPLVLTPLHQL